MVGDTVLAASKLSQNHMSFYIQHSAKLIQELCFSKVSNAVRAVASNGTDAEFSHQRESPIVCV